MHSTTEDWVLRDASHIRKQEAKEQDSFRAQESAILKESEIPMYRQDSSKKGRESSAKSKKSTSPKQKSLEKKKAYEEELSIPLLSPEKEEDERNELDHISAEIFDKHRSV